jgi:transposase
MIQITPHMRIFIALEHIDFRNGIDGLAAACRQRLQQDPFSGTMFLFRNRQRNTLKILIYDGQVFWLCTKRLSSGKFHWWPDEKRPFVSIESHELQTLHS